ncbi:hypothetical protein A4X09_0g4670 [Tilletia walkeri]|uniref:Rab proteins geranylgeranyltransferase n=1 Tax=Tilletia walkeri TaxID=117179 RepID=A0A8X7T4T6_9BASI|nr:hypothetical protein A4X09_0g4670 [Tilletia walkeri]
MADTDSASGGGERGSGGVRLDLEKTHYDTLIVGTGLTESILAASLSNNPAHSVLHIDSNPWYGNTSASLSLRELISVAHEEGEGSTSIYAPQLRFPAFEEEEGEGQGAIPSEPPAPLVSLDRHFALSLCPTLLPGAGPTIDVLIRSGVASYCTFRMLEHTFVYQPSSSESDASDALAGLKRVPSSKEDIFKDRTISLPDKRRLMKVLTEVTSSLDSQQSQSTSTDQPFLDFLSKGQGLSTPLASALAYGVALCSSQQEPTSQALNKMRTHMRSMGKYGQGAYLVGQYGGAGELAQGYCRACAVSGGTYILGHKLRSVRREVSVDGSSSPIWKADIGGNQVTADWLVLDQDHSHLAGGGEGGETDDEGLDLVLGHVVLNRPFHLLRSSSANAEEKDPLPPETALVAFPPEGGDEMTTFVLMNGEGTFSTPKGQYIYYLMTSVPRSDQRSSSEILLKVRDRVLALTEGAKEEWKPAPSSDDQQISLPSTTPLPPILEAYHRRRIPAAASLTTSADDRLLRVPFPPSLPQAGSPTTSSSSSPPLPGLSTSLDTATALAESLFWIIGGGEKARARAEAAQKRKSRRERDEEEFAGRAVALAGVRDQKKDEEEDEEEEEEEVIWDFFPKKGDRVDDDDD